MIYEFCSRYQGKVWEHNTVITTYSKVYNGKIITDYKFKFQVSDEFLDVHELNMRIAY